MKDIDFLLLYQYNIGRMTFIPPTRLIIINPRSSTHEKYSKDYQFQPTDTLFMISYVKPDIAEYFLVKTEDVDK